MVLSWSYKTLQRYCGIRYYAYDLICYIFYAKWYTCALEIICKIKVNPSFMLKYRKKIVENVHGKYVENYGSIEGPYLTS